MRSVFSESMKVVQFGSDRPPGGAEGWHAVTRVLQSCADRLLNDSVTTIFPDDCTICHRPLTAWSSTPICTSCVERVVPQTGMLCNICGEVLAMESARFGTVLGMNSCTECRLAPPDFARAVAFATYEDEMREMLHLLKYERMLRLASTQLGKWMAEAVLLLESDAGSDLIVVAVPLFPAREAQRGFNQSVLLADAAVARLRKLRPLWKLTTQHGALKRVKDTEAQFALSARARRKNLRAAFQASETAAVRGREVLLIDDILTTGATARECSRVLMRAGAARVWIATLARAQAESIVAGARDVAMWDVSEPGVATGFVQSARINERTTETTATSL